jgi:DNA/RNA endonuclease YhcR with UshA esterase domain
MIQSLALGDRVKITGAAAVLPGILGLQYFYIAGEGGTQVYNYKKEFPSFKIGDILEITGEVSEANGERRVKTSCAADIRVVSAGGSLAAKELSCDSANDPAAAGLIKLSGQVTERKGSVVFLDDGTDEAVVYIKKYTGISPSVFKEGSIYEITGVIGRTTSGSRLLPRSPSDIVLIGTGGGENETAGVVLGESADADKITFEEKKDRRGFISKISLVLSGLLIASALVWEYRKRVNGKGGG